MGDILKAHVGISEGEPSEAISARLAAHPYLGLTLGIGSEEELHPLVARERLHDAWVGFVDELAVNRPVVLLIEDAHWAEDQLCDLLDTLIAHVTGPLLLLVTGRQELLDRRPAWGGSRSRTSALQLEPLKATDTGRLLGELLGTEVPAKMRDLIVERAEGNPFFVEELIATFVDHGVLQRSNGTWAFGQLPAGFAVPDSVQAVLAARIDLLADAEKSALQAASVIGRTFWTGPMYELVGAEHPDIGILEDREFVRRQPTSTLPGEREYLIKHALTREVAYQSLPRAKRAQLHADFAGWLDRRAEGHDELAPFLAHHYAAAVRSEDLDLAWTGRDAEVEQLRGKALTWLRRAADLAIGRYEIDDGISLLRRAVELEPDQARQAALWYEIGHANALKYDGTGMVAAMDRALELGADPGEVYPELAFQWALRSGMWPARLDDSVTEDCVHRAITDSAEGSASRVLALVAKSLAEDDLEAGRAALAIADTLGDVVLRFDALGAVVQVLHEKGDYSASFEAAAQRNELLPRVGDPDRVADALFVDAHENASIGRLAEARSLAERMEEAVANLTPHHRVHALEIRMMVVGAEGDWEAVRALTQRVEETIEANLATPCPFNRGGLVELATAWTYAGNTFEADRLLAKAEGVGMRSYVRIDAPRRLALAIARHDLLEIRKLVDMIETAWLTPGNWDIATALLDGLVELDDSERIEAVAPPGVSAGLLATPFAKRARAVARRDEVLLEEAAAQFEAMHLGRRASETRTWRERLT
jgi:tetratricopeptide (TPR) repeat protein